MNEPYIYMDDKDGLWLLPSVIYQEQNDGIFG